nr:RNA-directed DNA polymerase, eukaryota, reverse transcriptase zinc-binding domain protein [Tanacetum cinerariifolium]
GYNRNINNVRAKEGVTTGSSKSYVHAVKVKNMFGALECDSMPSIVLDDECLISKDLSKALLGRVKEFASLPNLKIIAAKWGELLDVDDQEEEGFYSKRQFWSSIENDVFAAVTHFFTFGDIPNGCNSCFIVLIPKVPDANLVKDFRPISLIGSMYKIIAKILANRLVGVLGDIVNEVQSAFITERQILDGPFILNEVIQWCKLKKKQSLIFKVDFEKAYDSVRWDFLDDVLKKFGFGNKWCAWIQSCLRSSRGSIIINDSPTALMMKWVWSFYSQKESLWARVIKAIYGDDRHVGKVSKAGSRSCWRNIVNEDDNWIGGKVLKYSFPRIYALKTEKEVTVNSKMSDTRLENSLCLSIRGEGSEELFVASIRKIIDDNRLSTVDTRTLWIKYVPIK